MTKPEIKFYYHILRTALSYALFPNKKIKRQEMVVKDTYSQNYNVMSNEDFMYRQERFLTSRRFVIWPVIKHKKFLMESFVQRLKKYNPKSILELGSGRGFNLLSLAVMMPELKVIRGVELTAEGVKTAKANIKNPSLKILSEITGLKEAEVAKRLFGRDIDVVEGSIRKLPFRDNEFDAVFSNSVIEQIPDDYLLVFGEAFRVAGKVGVWSEPFREAQNGNPFKLLYLKNIDYFRASYKEVGKVGWRIDDFSVPTDQKFVFSTGFLVGVKR